MLEIRNEDPGDDDSKHFVSRKALCAVSQRIQNLVPTPRSWPILLWEEVVDEHIEGQWAGFWGLFDEFLRFAYTGTYEDVAGIGFTFGWCMGAALGSPKLQNAVMKDLMRDDSVDEAEMSYAPTEKENLECVVRHELDAINRSGVKHIRDGTYETHKLFSYMVRQYPTQT